MKLNRLLRQWLIPGACLLGVGGCLGPNPGFFVASSAANAAIFTVVNTLLTNLPGFGGS